MCHPESMGNLKDDDRYPIITGQLHGDTLVSVTLAGLQWLKSVMRVGSKHGSCLDRWGNADHRVADMHCLCLCVVFSVTSNHNPMPFSRTIHAITDTRGRKFHDTHTYRWAAIINKVSDTRGVA